MEGILKVLKVHSSQEFSDAIDRLCLFLNRHSYQRQIYLVITLAWQMILLKDKYY